MPKPYSFDLRQKVVNAIELDGMKKSEASAVFGLSRNTIDLWLKRKVATGSLAPQVNSNSSLSAADYRLGQVSRVCRAALS